MKLLRILCASAVAMGAFAAAPASAQFFLVEKDMKGDAVRGHETGLGQELPGATEVEQRAALVWNMRAALNVAALQCQFEPTLMTQTNYNVILMNHADELKKSYDVLTKYFARNGKTVKAGQTALDQFGTRTYSSFTTVSAQYGFCQTAARIARDAIFAPRGSFYTIAENRTPRAAQQPDPDRRAALPARPSVHPSGRHPAPFRRDMLGQEGLLDREEVRRLPAERHQLRA